MRLHRSTSEAVVFALEQIFSEGRYADKVIEKVLKQNRKWGARDRRFIAETTYDIVRWYLLIRYCVRAHEGEYWKLLGGWLVLKNSLIPEWQEFSGIKPSEVKERHQQAIKVRPYRESVPEWLDTLCAGELGDVWDREARALNEEAEVVLRTNTIKTTPRELLERLDEEGIVARPLREYGDAVVLEERQAIFSSPLFKEGLFEVQDAASQLIAPFLKPEPGMRVIDACAGAGGKTLHLAALMENKGRIIAMDVEQWKLDELQKRARRAGVSNMETRLIETSKTIKRLESTADRLLLDVPCSGLGVLRRNPDAKWKLAPQFIDEVRQLQQHILNDYCTMVRKGGLIAYSTCSILPSENERQVEQFLRDQQGKFVLLDERHCLPSEGFDGFYMALLRRE